MEKISEQTKMIKNEIVEKEKHTAKKNNTSPDPIL